MALTPEQRREQASKGGKARAAKLNGPQKKAVAAQGGKARWGAELRAAHPGALKLINMEISCAVLSDGRRVIMQNDFMRALGRYPRGYEGGIKEEISTISSIASLPPFLDVQNLKPFISDDLHQYLAPVQFRTREGKRAIGYDARLLPKVCRVYLLAREQGKLHLVQEHVAKACETLVCALAQIGIVALIDEATGYQYDRAHDALQQLLKLYVAEEIRPWVRQFSPEFFKGAYRLCGWEYNDGAPAKPHMLGTLINRVVYQKLPQEVVDEIKARNPLQGNKRRKYTNHQFLTKETGIPHLDRVLTIATAMMQAYDSREAFYAAYDRAVPTPPRVVDALDTLDHANDPKQP